MDNHFRMQYSWLLGHIVRVSPVTETAGKTELSRCVPQGERDEAGGRRFVCASLGIGDFRCPMW